MYLTRENKTCLSSGGFSMIELIVAMALFAMVIVAASNVFIPVIGQSKQQSRITETQMEGIIGLDILRRDIEGAGYGIPWNAIGAEDTDGDGNVWEHLPNYAEALPDTSATVDPALFNDATRDTDGDGLIGEAPRGILSGDNVGLNNSDYLVIKSVSVASSSLNIAAHKWTSILSGNDPKQWNSLDEDLDDNDLVTVMRPVASGNKFKELIVADEGAGLRFFTAFTQNAFPAEFAPFQPNETFLIFGVSSTADSLRMPFNRADFFIAPGAPA
ncbi:MAG: PilW family protein, partial [Thermodesulfovibrionales bacterium]